MPLATVHPIFPADGQQADQLPVTAADASSAWLQLPEKKRKVASERKQLIDACLARVAPGVSKSASVECVLAAIEAGNTEPGLIAVAMRLGRKARAPSRATVLRWIADYEAGGMCGLAPGYDGRQRQDYGWEAEAIAYYNRPSKPAMNAVADWLRADGYESATDDRVRRFLNSLPAQLGSHGRGRVGAHEYRLTQAKYQRRDTTVLPVGGLYQGDGHTVDVYVAHPTTGGIWRPELTVWMDIRSRFIVGWYISEAESSLSTLFALSHAMIGWDHVPAVLHIDNGAGFKSKMMNDESVGFYDTWSISATFSIPGNPRGKGQVERWFRTMEERFGKRWPSYCGDDMADEAKQRVYREVKAGRYELPSLQTYMQELAGYIDRYNNTVHSALDGQTPAQLWAQLERTPLHTPAAAVIRPRITRVVQRGTISLHNREYTNPELFAWNRSSVTVEYDVHDDTTVRILTPQDKRWICDAELVKKVDYLPASRVDEAQQRRLEGQRKRLQRKLDEAEARSALAITHEDGLQDVELLNKSATETLEQSEDNPLFKGITIDVLDTNY